MEKLKVSIVTAAYNSAATIEDTVRSVVAQTYEPVEHIIVDGGSTDGTVEVVKELERLYAPGKRLVVGSGPDRGIYDAMNKGIARATGDVIGILNSDDFFSSPNSLGRLMDALTKDVDAVYADLHYVSDSDLTVPLRIYHSGAFSRRRMLMGMQPAHPTFYCRRKCYERFGGFDIDFKVAADFEQLLRMIYVGRIRTCYVPFDCVTMRLGGASTSGLASHRQIMRDHRRAYKKNHVPGNFFTDSLRYFWKLGELAGARLRWNRNELND